MSLPKISFLIPVYKDSYKQLAGSIPAIMDQDWPHDKIEIVICLDGKNEKARRFIEEGDYYHRDREGLTTKRRNELLMAAEKVMKVIEIKHGGAPAARNAAFDASTGDYVCATDPDIYWYPGSIRELIESLEDNPDYAFAYGHYDFVGGYQIHAREFNLRALRTTNYISGAFPIRRAAFGRWDPAFKSLQDYDFWLTVTDNGHKGLFINKSFFITEPAGQFISKDSSENWLERVQQVKDKHGISRKDIVVSSIGAEHHALHVAEKLDADFQTMPSWKPHQYKKIYLLGFYPESAKDHFRIFMKRYPERDGDMPGFTDATKVIHWIGSDIRGLRRSVGWEQLKELAATFKKNNFIHLCEAPHTQKRLADVGIKAKIVPIPPKHHYAETLPLPKKFTVAIYENGTQPHVYMPELMAEVVRAMPDVQFRFFGDPANTASRKNVEHCGWVDDMPAFTKQCSAILRVTTHDGLPLGPLEFLMAGRQAITNVPLLGAVQCLPTRESIVAAIREAKKKQLNPLVSMYWRWKLSPDRYRKAIEAL